MQSTPLIAKPEGLKPSVPVRIVIFWAPTVAAVVGLSFWPWFQGLGIILEVLLGFLVVLCVLCVSGYFAAVWPLKPLPTDDELAAIGGKRFLRPSDGKPMEYWLSGQLGAKKVVVFCHRMDGKMGVDFARAKVEPMLQAKGACLLSASVPCISASPPYETLKGVQWLQQYCQDMLHILGELGAEEVYVMGWSWGAQLCLNLAMACQEKGLLRGISLIGGFYWDTKRITYEMSADTGGAFAKALFAAPSVVRPMAYLMMRPFLSMAADPSTLPEKEAPYVKEYWGYPDLTLYGEEMLRSMSFSLYQMWQLGALAGAREVDHYVDLSKFDTSIPMHANLGKEDQLSDQQQKPFLEQVPHAQLKMREGSHMGCPLDVIIEDILSA